MAKDTKSPFLLSYHDVRASNWQQVREELAILANWGFPHWTLLVVPDCAPDQRSEFQTALQNFRDEGHELCLHGFKHKANLSLKRSCFGTLLQQLTHGEAEFAGLDDTGCRSVLEESIRAWDRLGMGRAEGFVPPTWHAPEMLAEIALDIGWSFYEERLVIHLQSQGRRQVSSIPVSFAGMPEFLHPLIVWIGKVLVPVLSGVPRLVLHPGELSGRNADGIHRLLEAWAARRTAISYKELSQNLPESG